MYAAPNHSALARPVEPKAPDRRSQPRGVDRRSTIRSITEESFFNGGPILVEVRQQDATYRFLKRMIDVVLSGGAIIALMPLFTLVAFAIKLTSRGPILFSQQRVGLGGAHFKMYKFRTMVTNAEELKVKLAALNEQSGPAFKMKNDPRITRVGGFLRRHSIDELPQLWNVFKGDMSIVGPRPAVPAEVAKYRRWYARRVSVKPGLTCIWQVSGRNKISFEEWMRMDMRYITRQSLALDFNLILKTIRVVIVGDGA